jgi:hypothetical protein
MLTDKKESGKTRLYAISQRDSREEPYMKHAMPIAPKSLAQAGIVRRISVPRPWHCGQGIVPGGCIGTLHTEQTEILSDLHQS